MLAPALGSSISSTSSRACKELTTKALPISNGAAVGGSSKRRPPFVAQLTQPWVSLSKGCTSNLRLSGAFPCPKMRIRCPLAILPTSELKGASVARKATSSMATAVASTGKAAKGPAAVAIELGVAEDDEELPLCCARLLSSAAAAATSMTARCLSCSKASCCCNCSSNSLRVFSASTAQSSATVAAAATILLEKAPGLVRFLVMAAWPV
mmetsp:Transcript_84704/g.220544  ORF Transcript_84704/g.220544 Transcript_84704/m.220544 type:complete len:210 (+) Transcript_84704:445-1074(+)